MKNNKYLIIGSGLTGLMVARFIRKYKDNNAEIIIIEKDDQIGGLFSSKKYDHGYFDYGMHVYYDSCVAEIDDLVYEALPESEWHIMSDNKKDVAGIYVNEKLQITTPYVDLRNFPDNKKVSFIGDLFLSTAKTEKSQKDNAYEEMEKHFGKVITDEVFVSIFEKLYDRHLSKLSDLALRLTAVDRVALFDSSSMQDLMKSELIRSKICYPDQLNLPPFRTNNQRALYPKKYGMIRMIDGLKKILLDEGVVFHISAFVKELILNNYKIAELTIEKRTKEIKFDNITEVIWTAGIVPLSMILGNQHLDLSFEPSPPSYFMNFLFNKPLNMDKLHYFYCFDKGYRSFRITNYYNYCENALSKRGCPACIEFWLKPGDDTNENSLIKRALHELNEFGVIDDTYKVLFVKAERSVGFPIPSVRNAESLGEIRQRIRDRRISNLISAGVMSEKNLFFISDILKDAYNKIISKDTLV